MKQKLWMLLLAGSLVWQGVGLYATYLLSKQVHQPSLEQIQKSVVVLVDTDKHTMCAGSIIDKRGWILTAGHCVVDIQDHFEISLKGEDTKFQAQVGAVDHQRDLALVRILNAPKNLPCIKLAATNPSVGDSVWVIGHPLTHLWLVSRGIVNGFESMQYSKGMPVEKLETDALINPGNSGGPIINQKGQIVGVVSSMDIVPTPFGIFKAGIGNCISLNEVQQFLQDVKHLSQGVRDQLYN